MKIYTVHEVLESTKKKLEEVTAERDKYKELYESSMLSEATAKQYAEQLECDVSTAIGTCAYMDPPDGGSVSLPEQVRRMRADRDALAATVGALREAWVAVKRNDWDTPLNEAFEKTPQHHLRQVRADGVIDAANEHEKKYGNSHFGRHMREYAASILAGKE